MADGLTLFRVYHDDPRTDPAKRPTRHYVVARSIQTLEYAEPRGGKPRELDPAREIAHVQLAA